VYPLVALIMAFVRLQNIIQKYDQIWPAPKQTQLQELQALVFST
jgi:hypothetical protein